MTRPATDQDRITGDGLVLRQWRESDLDVMVVLFDAPDIAGRTPLPSPFTIDEARARLVRAQTGEPLMLAITTDGAEPRGEVLLMADGTMGYALGVRHRGQGLAARALRLLRDHAHAVLGTELLRLEIEPDNAPSIRVAERADFRLAQPAAKTGELKGRPYVLDVWEHRAT